MILNTNKKKKPCQPRTEWKKNLHGKQVMGNLKNIKQISREHYLESKVPPFMLWQITEHSLPHPKFGLAYWPFDHYYQAVWTKINYEFPQV